MGARWLLAAAVVVAFVPLSRLLDAVAGPAPRGGTTASAAPVRPAPFAPAVPSGPATTADAAVIARAPAAGIQLFDAPAGIARRRTLRTAPPLVLLVTRRRGPWLEVDGPGGAGGWVRRDLVRVVRSDWRTRVDLGDQTVTTWRGRRRISVHPARTAPAGPPVPRGRSFLARRRDGGFELSRGGVVLSARGAGIRVPPDVIASFRRHFPLGTPVIVRS